jgi:ubiquinone/menaquinone biosynthesis C-methylase UbiE
MGIEPKHSTAKLHTNSGVQHTAGTSERRLLELAWSFAGPLIIETSLRLGVFEALKNGSRTVEEVARATGASPRGVRVLADALVGLQLIDRRGARYRLTEDSAEMLVRDARRFRGDFFRYLSDEVVPCWLRLTDTVRTGIPARRVNTEAGGTRFFREFVESLFALRIDAARVLASTLQVERMRGPVSVLDVGAGSAVWSIALAQRSSNVRVTAVDWKGLLPVARRMTQREGVADRYRFVPGDIAAAKFGSGHQIAVLGHILHSEGGMRSKRLLRKVHRALAPGGRVAIAEFLIDDSRRGPLVSLAFAVNMLLYTDAGSAFTFREIASWLREAGFTGVRKVQAPAPSPLIVARRK